MSCPWLANSHTGSRKYKFRKGSRPRACALRNLRGAPWRGVKKAAKNGNMGSPRWAQGRCCMYVLRACLFATVRVERAYRPAAALYLRVLPPKKRKTKSCQTAQTTKKSPRSKVCVRSVCVNVLCSCDLSVFIKLTKCSPSAWCSFYPACIAIHATA